MPTCEACGEEARTLVPVYGVRYCLRCLNVDVTEEDFGPEPLDFSTGRPSHWNEPEDIKTDHEAVYGGNYRP